MPQKSEMKKVGEELAAVHAKAEKAFVERVAAFQKALQSQLAAIAVGFSAGGDPVGFRKSYESARIAREESRKAVFEFVEFTISTEIGGKISGVSKSGRAYHAECDSGGQLHVSFEKDSQLRPGVEKMITVSGGRLHEVPADVADDLVPSVIVKAELARDRGRERDDGTSVLSSVEFGSVVFFVTEDEAKESEVCRRHLSGSTLFPMKSSMSFGVPVTHFGGFEEGSPVDAVAVLRDKKDDFSVLLDSGEVCPLHEFGGESQKQLTSLVAGVLAAKVADAELWGQQTDEMASKLSELWLEHYGPVKPETVVLHELCDGVECACLPVDMKISGDREVTAIYLNVSDARDEDIEAANLYFRIRGQTFPDEAGDLNGEDASELCKLVASPWIDMVNDVEEESPAVQSAAPADTKKAFRPSAAKSAARPKRVR